MVEVEWDDPDPPVGFPGEELNKRRGEILTYLVELRTFYEADIDSLTTSKRVPLSR